MPLPRQSTLERTILLPILILVVAMLLLLLLLRIMPLRTPTHITGPILATAAGQEGEEVL